MTPTPRPARLRYRHALWLAPLLLAACEGRQSALVPAGEDARILGDLFWVMLIGAVLLWIGMNGLFYWATRRSPAPHSQTLANWLVIIGGILFRPSRSAPCWSMACRSCPTCAPPATGR